MMADTWKERADALMEMFKEPFTPEYETAKVQSLALVNERVDADGLRGKVWGAMQYACENGHREWFALEVGVEGPPTYHADGTYMACAFYAGRCDTCKLAMKHENFARDLEFKPQEPDAFLPNGEMATNIFRLPREPVKWCSHLDDDGTPLYSTGDGAYLQVNMGAIRLKWPVK